MKTLHRFIAVFPKSKQFSQYLTDCRLVVTMMTGNASLPNPTPQLAQVTTHLDTLEAAEELARKGGKGAVQQRNVELGMVRNDMRLLKAFVQSTADAHAAEAESIIMGAGMDVGKKGTRTKPAVAAKHGKVPGAVVLEAKALQRPVQYRWQMSINQQSWTDLPETFTATTTVEGLTAATIHFFRLRTVTRNGPSDWSVPVSIIVH